MTTKQSLTPAPQAPTDDPIAPATANSSDGSNASTGGKKVPQRGARKRVLGEGEGDYLITELVGEGTQMPRGSMIPIPGVPQFEDTSKALAWIRNESGDLLAGKQVAIIRVCEILSLTVQQQPKVVIQTKPKVAITKQTETSSNG